MTSIISGNVLTMPTTIANAGVPMILVQWVGMAIALVPIIIVETFILWASIRQSYGRLFAVAALANVITTVVGVPIAWFLSCISGTFLNAAVNWSNDQAIHAATHPPGFTLMRMTSGG